MNVLSTFGGMEVGRFALKNNNIKIDNYYTSEIDEDAIAVANKNHNDLIHVGDITKLKGSDFKDIDLLIGGSPCQGFSFAGKQLNFEDPRSILFFEFLRLKNEIKPKYFFFENVYMNIKYQEKISELLGCEPVLVNSFTFGAQFRKRLYWTNIPYPELPTENSTVLKDILIETSIEGERELSLEKPIMLYNIYPSKGVNGNIYSAYGKSKPLMAGTGKLGRSSSSNAPKITWDNEKGWRSLTVNECERLMGLPDNYTDCVNASRAFKCLGNGWELNTITHFFKGLKKI